MDVKKNVRDLTLMDRILYAEAIEDKDFAENMISIILGDRYVVSGAPQAEKEMRNVLLKKFVRLDAYLKMYLYAVEHCQIIVETEIQKEKDDYLPKRIRHYVAMIDVSLIEPGETDYSKMENICLIVIASYDVGGRGKYKHRITSRSDDEQPLELEDGIEKIFLYTKGNDPENISDELRWMLYYFENTTEQVAQQSESRRLMKMSECVERIKKNPIFDLKAQRELEEREYLKKKAIAEGHAEGHAEGRAEGHAEGRAEGHAEGRAEGLAEAHKADALEMKKDGVPIEKIMKYTKLPRNVIETL